jgi:hypothetical protein
MLRCKKRVADPHSLDPDPDPIRIQGFFDDKKKLTAEQKIDQKLQFTFFLGLHKERLSYRRSLKL